MGINKKSLLADLKYQLELKFFDNLKDVVLFGSHLTGKAHKSSDYDILIVLKQKVDWKAEREISDICYSIDLKYDIVTDTHVVSEPELLALRGKQPIFVNALSNGLYAWLPIKIDELS